MTDYVLVDLNWHASLTSLRKIHFPLRKVGRTRNKNGVYPQNIEC
jgi:hypothetical protein